MTHEEKDEPPMGPTIARNLYRLGYADIVVRSTDLAKLVQEKTGKPMSRQRIAAITNAVRVTDETVAMLAKAIGVKPADLLKAEEARAAKSRGAK